jgi:hypothetical protein
MTPPPIQFKHVLAYKRNNNSAPVTMMPPASKGLAGERSSGSLLRLSIRTESTIATAGHPTVCTDDFSSHLRTSPVVLPLGGRLRQWT